MEIESWAKIAELEKRNEELLEKMKDSNAWLTETMRAVFAYMPDSKERGQIFECLRRSVMPLFTEIYRKEYEEFKADQEQTDRNQP